MKQFFLFCVIAVIPAILFAQAPQSFKYQAIARDGLGAVIANHPVAFQITILSGSPTGNPEYVETHTTTTNAFGLVTLTIGDGTFVSGNFAAIPWASASEFIKIEMDPEGGVAWTEMGTAQLMSVPYALFAASGNQGPAGISIIWLGTFAAPPSSPALNNAYYNSADKKSYIWNGTSWDILTIDGLDGTDGTDGISVAWLGTFAAPPASPLLNNAYYNSADKTSYIWNGSVWNVLAIDGIQGPQGPAGPAGTGLNNRGDWTSGSTYNSSDYVFDESSSNPAVNSMWICQAASSFTSTIQPHNDLTNWVEFEAPAGPPGANGTSIVWLGTFATPPASPVTNNAYYNSADKKSYIWNGSSWQILAQDGLPANYTAGTGININTGTITNTLPDQTVVINAGAGISATGTYPNFTIANTAPNQAVTLTGAGATSISGAYPNFTITSVNTTYTASTGLTLTGTAFSLTSPVAVNLGGTGQTTYINGQLLIGNTTGNTLIKSTLTPGTGIGITNGAGSITINNSLPDQTVVLSGTGATSVTGTYPNFTINSSDNNTIYTGGTGINVAGTTISSTQNLAQTLTNGNSAGFNSIDMNNQSIYSATTIGFGPSNANYLDFFWGHIRDYNSSHGIDGQVLRVRGTSPNTYVLWEDEYSYTPGTGLSLIGNTLNSVWSVNGNHIFNNNSGNVGIGTSSPVGKLVVKGDISAPVTDPLFEVKNAAGQTVFVVYPDSVHIYVKDEAAKTNKGGFAVSGRNTSKALTNNFLLVTPDSSRVYTGDPLLGFGVEGINGSASTSYMQLTPDNYFIGHESGISITTGQYNSTLGYKAGRNMTVGNYNVFLGYETGLANINGISNVFIGYRSGYSNTGGTGAYGCFNVFIGRESGYDNSTGWNNTFIGDQAGSNNTVARFNTFIGAECGISNTTGESNSYLGQRVGYYNNFGSNNTCLGFEAGFGDIGGSNYSANVFIGASSGKSTTTGSDNVFVGSGACINTTTGQRNVAIGTSTGANNISGRENIFAGYMAGYSNNYANYNTYIGGYCGRGDASGENNVMIGHSTGYSATSGGNNTYVGANAGYNSNGTGNVFIGYQAGFNENVSGRLFIDNTGTPVPLIWGDFDWHWVGINRVASGNTFEVGGDASKTTAGAWLANSDRRIKTNIEDIKDACDIVLKLHPVKFKYTEEWMKKNPTIKDHYYYNFIAQEYKTVFPEAVKGSGEYIDGDANEILQIDSYNAQIVTIQAVQDLIRQNRLLEQKVDFLTKENAQLKTNTDEMLKLKADVETLKSLIESTAKK